MTDAARPSFTLDTSSGQPVLRVEGDWTISTIGVLDRELRDTGEAGQGAAVDVSALGALDTAGAFVIDRTVRIVGADTVPPLLGDHSNAGALLAKMQDTHAVYDPGGGDEHFGLALLLDRTGRGTISALNEGAATLSFLGQTLVTCGRLLLNPRKIRWTSTFAVMERAGVDAIPIVAFLSFFVGLVVAYMGATTLSALAGSTGEVYTVELVGISVLREFGVLLTAIILAGRTNSAFTAQIGAMKMRQEIDAMQTLGLKPMEVLVAPRVFALLVMLPVLTFVGMISGLFGGFMVSWLALDISPTTFVQRIEDWVPVQNFWVGMSKAPVFALVLALVGCRQGLAVGGSVQSLGSRTTTSVVQAIFSIIVIDAIFAIFYMELGW